MTFKMGLNLKMTLVVYGITVQNVVLLPENAQLSCYTAALLPQPGVCTMHYRSYYSKCRPVSGNLFFIGGPDGCQEIDSGPHVHYISLL